MVCNTPYEYTTRKGARLESWIILWDAKYRIRRIQGGSKRPKESSIMMGISPTRIQECHRCRGAADQAKQAGHDNRKNQTHRPRTWTASDRPTACGSAVKALAVKINFMVIPNSENLAAAIPKRAWHCYSIYGLVIKANCFMAQTGQQCSHLAPKQPVILGC